MIRNVAVVGHLHHGKTALLDMLVFETHKLVWDADKPVCTIPLPLGTMLTSHNRHGTLTHMCYRENAASQSNRHPCPWSSPQRPENRI